jgi:hypothetical protein
MKHPVFVNSRMEPGQDPGTLFTGKGSTPADIEQKFNPGFDLVHMLAARTSPA